MIKSTVAIVPVRVLSGVGVSATFSPAMVTYGSVAVAQYQVNAEDGALLASGNVQTTPEQYANWGENDDYVIDCFLINLGLERAPTPPADPAP